MAVYGKRPGWRIIYKNTILPSLVLILFSFRHRFKPKYGCNDPKASSQQAIVACPFNLLTLTRRPAPLDLRAPERCRYGEETSDELAMAEESPHTLLDHPANLHNHAPRSHMLPRHIWHASVSILEQRPETYHRRLTVETARSLLF